MATKLFKGGYSFRLLRSAVLDAVSQSKDTYRRSTLWCVPTFHMQIYAID